MITEGRARTACRFARRRLAAELRVKAAEADGHPHGWDEPRIKRGRRHVIANLFVKATSRTANSYMQSGELLNLFLKVVF